MHGVAPAQMQHLRKLLKNAFWWWNLIEELKMACSQPQKLRNIIHTNIKSQLLKVLILPGHDMNEVKMKTVSTYNRKYYNTYSTLWHHVCEIYLKALQNLNQLKNKNRYSITHFYCPNYEEKTVILQSVGVIVKKFKKQVWLPILACILVSKLLNSVQQILYWSLNC